MKALKIIAEGIVLRILPCYDLCHHPKYAFGKIYWSQMKCHISEILTL